MRRLHASQGLRSVPERRGRLSDKDVARGAEVAGVSAEALRHCDGHKLPAPGTQPGSLPQLTDLSYQAGQAQVSQEGGEAAGKCWQG